MASRLMRAAAAGAVALGVMAAAAAPAAAVGPEGNQGCTPGYWKNHQDRWNGPEDPGIGDEPLRPGFPLRWAFDTSGNIFNGTDPLVAQYANTTMATALAFNGGGGLDGAARILLRAATAAYLNAAHDGVQFPLHRFEDSETVPEKSLYFQLNAALHGSRADMLALAEKLDRYNNGPGGCPLN
jgi:hypothetical protein